MVNPKKLAQEAYDKAYKSWQDKCKANDDMSCKKLDKALDCITKKRDGVKLWSTSGRGARRVRDRNLEATKNWKNKI